MQEYQLILSLYIFSILYASALLTSLAVLIPRLNKARAVLLNAQIIDLRTKYDQELLLSQIEIQKDTLTTLGRELHDNIGQKIYLARLLLSQLKTEAVDNKDSLNSIDLSLEEAAGDLHSLL